MTVRREIGTGGHPDSSRRRAADDPEESAIAAGQGQLGHGGGGGTRDTGDERAHGGPSAGCQGGRELDVVEIVLVGLKGERDGGGGLQNDLLDAARHRNGHAGKRLKLGGGEKAVGDGEFVEQTVEGVVRRAGRVEVCPDDQWPGIHGADGGCGLDIGLAIEGETDELGDRIEGGAEVVPAGVGDGER